MGQIKVSAGGRNVRHLLKALRDSEKGPVRTKWEYGDEQVDEKTVVGEHADPVTGAEEVVGRRIRGKTVD